MSVAGSQQRTALRLLGELRPHWHKDRALPLRVENTLRMNRSIGSRDRRLYRELVYTTLRFLPWIEPLLESNAEKALKIAAWLAAETKATAAFRAALCADWPERPRGLAEQAAFLGTDAATLLPEWFREHCPQVFEPTELEAQLRRAPLWLRVAEEGLADVQRELDALGWRYAASPLLPTALRIFPEVDVTKLETFSRGLIEVQDLGSQLVLAGAGIAPGGRWLDGCAGAGGKTLQLARLVGPDGTVDAHDIRPAALEELATRATRAGANNIRILAQPPAEMYDGVLVDAPCSGTGTWRRAPHLKWTTFPSTIAESAARQLKILTRLAARVRPGGRLIYATCSLSRRENEDVVAEFLAAHAEFALDDAQARPQRTLFPAQYDTDGFFVAALRRK